MYKFVKSGDLAVLESLIDPKQSIEVIMTIIRQNQSIVETNLQIVKVLGTTIVHFSDETTGSSISE